MVVMNIFQDLFEISRENAAFSLPVYKEASLKIEFQEADDTETIYEGAAPGLPFAKSDIFHACIIKSRRLTAFADGCKDVYEITLDVTDSDISHQPGDTVGVIPHNSDAEVNEILSRLDIKSYENLPYRLSVDRGVKGTKIPPHIPVKSTLKYVLRNCLDLRSVIKKMFILALSKYTKDKNERKVLEYICSKEGATAYTTHVLNQKLCILDLLALFPSCKPPIEVLLANLSRLLPRPYSIVNSGMKDPNRIKICFSVMDLGNNRKGLTTGWLHNVISSSELENKMTYLRISADKPNDDTIKVPIYLRNNVSGFSMPKNLDTPLLLLSPGTGVAPFIGFLEERQSLKEKYGNMRLGDTWLFFGCRDPKLDFIYEEELSEFIRDGVLNKLNTAFSRVDDGPKYIQDAILEKGEEVTKFITKGASVFICGDLKNMVTQIREVLTQCLVQYDEKTKEESEAYLAHMQKEKRYFVDAWS